MPHKFLRIFHTLENSKFCTVFFQNRVKNSSNLNLWSVCTVLVPNFHCVHVFVVIHNISKIANFTRDFLKTVNDSEITVKTKNVPLFMNFPNIYKLWQFWFKAWFRVFVVIHNISKIANFKRDFLGNDNDSEVTRFNKFVYYNENMNSFKRNFLKNYNDLEDAVKTKNAPFFLIFPNISFFSHMVVTDRLVL